MQKPTETSDDRKKLQQLEKKLTKLTQKKEALISEITQLELGYSDAEALLARMQPGEDSTQSEQLDQLRNKITEKKQQVSENTEQLAKLQTALDSFSPDEEQVARLNEQRQNKQALSDKINTIKEQISEINTQTDRLKKEKKQSGSGYLNKKESLETSLATLKQKIQSHDQAKHHVDSLHNDLDALKRQEFKLNSEQKEMLAEEEKIQSVQFLNKEKLDGLTEESKLTKENIVKAEAHKERLSEKIDTFIEKFETVYSKHDLLKSNYDDAVAELRKFEETSKKNSTKLEKAYVEQEKHHDEIITRHEAKRAALISKQKQLRTAINKISESYQSFLTQSIADVDDRNKAIKLITEKATDRLQELQKLFSDNEEKRLERLKNGEDEAEINLERQHEEEELNSFTQKELERLRQQDEAEGAFRSSQKEKENDFLDKKAEREKELHGLDSELTDLKLAEQKELQTLAHKEQEENAAMDALSQEAVKQLTALRGGLDTAENALTEYEKEHSAADKVQSQTELAAAQNQLTQETGKITHYGEKTTRLDDEITEIKKLIDKNQEKLEAYPDLAQQITSQLTDLTHKQAALNEKLEHASSELDEIPVESNEQDEIHRLGADLKQLDEKQKGLDSESSAQIATLEDTKGQYIDQLDTLTEQVDLIQKDHLDQAEQAAADREQEEKALTDRKSKISDHGKALQDELNDLEKQKTELKSKHNKELQQKKEWKKSLKQKSSDAHKDLSSRKIELADVDIELAHAMDEAKQLRDKIETQPEPEPIESPAESVMQSELNEPIEYTEDKVEPEPESSPKVSEPDAKKKLKEKKEAVDDAIAKMKEKQKSLMSKDRAKKAVADEEAYQKIVDKVATKVVDEKEQQTEYQSDEVLYEEFLQILSDRKKTRGGSVSQEMLELEKLAKDKMEAQKQKAQLLENQQPATVEQQGLAPDARRQLLSQAAIDNEINSDVVAYKSLMDEIKKNKNRPTLPDISMQAPDVSTQKDELAAEGNTIEKPLKPDVTDGVEEGGQAKLNVIEAAEKIEIAEKAVQKSEPPVTEVPVSKPKPMEVTEEVAAESEEAEKDNEMAHEPPAAMETITAEPQVHTDDVEPVVDKETAIDKTKQAIETMKETFAEAGQGVKMTQPEMAAKPAESGARSSQKGAEKSDIDFISDSKTAVLSEKSPLSSIMLYSIIFFFIIIIVWARLTVLDEITNAQGKVIPSSQIQVIQNLEGGILSEIFVREGDTVEKDQVLLRIDDTRFSASFKEGKQKYLALLAAIARLTAEAEGAKEVTFPELVKKEVPEMIANEQSLFDKQKEQLDSSIQTLESSYSLAKEELDITKPLVAEGLMSKLELLRLQRQVNEIKGDLDKGKDEFRSKSQKELNEKKGELASLKEALKAAEDRFVRTTVRSPVNGTVNEVHISTIGAVIQPGMKILEIVPTEDNLLVEAKIKPQDIAFISPKQRALVKITAYDYQIYGGLEGVVEHISADTIDEENSNNREESYYKILVRTQKNYLGREDNPLYIIPGMTVSVDVMTGKKSVLDYLLKPILKARESAFRER